MCVSSEQYNTSDTTPRQVPVRVFPLNSTILLTQHHARYRYVCFLWTIQYYFVLTSSQMSCLLTPGLRFMIFSSAAFSTPSCVNSTFGFPCSPSTLTFLKYLRSKCPLWFLDCYRAAPHSQSNRAYSRLQGGMMETGSTDNQKRTRYCATNKK